MNGTFILSQILRFHTPFICYMNGQGFIAATNMKMEGQPSSITESRHTCAHTVWLFKLDFGGLSK